MRRPLVAGNWKMNGTAGSIAELLENLLAGFPEACSVEVAVCPPFIYIPQVDARLEGTPIRLGAQNVANHSKGAYTGEVSPLMLKEFGCRYAIAGHSERRRHYFETDALIAERYACAIEHGITPILCIGETLEEREAGRTFEVVMTQLEAVLAKAGVTSLRQAVIAYEPVWAIGTGRNATPEQAQEVHRFLRSQIAEQDPAVAEEVRILYGGSLNAENAASLFAMPDIDGGLVGGASLKAEAFLAIIQAAQEAKGPS